MPPLRTTVLTHLQQGWTPEQVAGRLARNAGRPVLFHETIYRFFYAQIAQTKPSAWRHSLPHAKATRGRRRTRRSPAALLAHRRPLADRPAAADRQAPGHGEADLMLFRTDGQARHHSPRAHLPPPPRRAPPPARPPSPSPTP